MLKTTRSWTMRVNTDKRGFTDAFYKFIKSKNHPLSLEASYRGRVFSESSFFLEKAINSDVIGFHRLDGEMIEDANGLLLELTLHPYINAFNYYAKAVAADVFLSYFFCLIPFVNVLIEEFFLLSVGVMLVPMFFVALWLMKKIKRITDYGLQARFNDQLNDIQKEAERRGHIPVY